MIELQKDALVFSFPEVHPGATLSVEFQRTLRIPDDGTDHFLPPGLGRFPLRHVDDFAKDVPCDWMRHGGVMLPMYQSEAMWLNFSPAHVDGHWVPYPFAVKVATGKVDAVTGKTWQEGLHRRPQDYVVAPEQPWLDGYCVEKGVIRQFVAMLLGAGYTAEEQVTGKAEHGGLQIAVYPMKREVFEERFPKRACDWGRHSVQYCSESLIPCAPDMGLAPGGRMRQEIYRDPFRLEDWDLGQTSRCFAHIANSMVWRTITGEKPPTVPPTAKAYTRAGLPWFDYYSDSPALGSSPVLGKLKSVLEMGGEKGEVPLPENESVTPAHVVELRKDLGRDQVREGAF